MKYAVLLLALMFVGVATPSMAQMLTFEFEGETIEVAEKLHLESLEIKRQLGDKKGISASLTNLGLLSMKQGKIEEAEKLHLESLEIKRELGDKDGISKSLNNLAVIYFEQGNDNAAIENFCESIILKRELKAIPNLVASIHRVFSLIDKEEQGRYNKELSSLDKREFTAKENCWLNNIQLMDDCMNNVSISVGDIQKIVTQIIHFCNQTTINDIDDLPVEAFYVATKKLIQLDAPEEAQELAKQALKWIGNRKTRRKEELEKMINSTTYNSV